jgi:predicted phage terminase large subunit-like protein
VSIPGLDLNGLPEDVQALIEGFKNDNSPEVRAKLRELAKINRKMKARRGREDAVFFGREILGHKDLDHDVYYEIDSVLESKNKRFKLVMIPRTCLKTTFCTETKAAQILVRDPDKRILITNAVLDNAEKMLGAIKYNLSENPGFVECYGSMRGSIWRDNEITVRGAKKRRKEMNIEIGSPERTKTSKHYDLIIADDLVTRENIKTAESKYGLYKYFMDLFDLLEHPGGEIWLIGTSWDFGDLYSLIQDPERKHLDDFEFFIRGAVDKDNNPNFPWKLPLSELEVLKRQKDTLEYSAQYLLKPVASENATFKEDYFKYYDVLPEGTYHKFMFVDPAATATKRSDYSAMIVVAVNAEDDWYILDIVRDRLVPSVLERRILKLANKHEPRIIGIEAFGFQTYVEKNLRDLMLKNPKGLFSVRPMSHSGKSKEDRIRRLEPRFRAGKIYMPKIMLYNNTDGKEMDMVFQLKDELLKFPRAEKDDLSDCLAYLDELAFRPVNRDYSMQHMNFKDRLSGIEHKQRDQELKRFALMQRKGISLEDNYGDD